MTPNVAIGRMLTLDEALLYYTRLSEAEKAMGPLSQDERMVILRTVGKDITAEELSDLLRGKKALILKHKE